VPRALQGMPSAAVAAAAEAARLRVELCRCVCTVLTGHRAVLLCQCLEAPPSSA
jgi:hypothetical protein